MVVFDPIMKTSIHIHFMMLCNPVTHFKASQKNEEQYSAELLVADAMPCCADQQSPGCAGKGKLHLVFKTYLCCLEQMQLQIALECPAPSARAPRPTSIINVFYEGFCVPVIKRCLLHAPSVMLFVWSRKV